MCKKCKCVCVGGGGVSDRDNQSTSEKKGSQDLWKKKTTIQTGFGLNPARVLEATSDISKKE